MFGVFYFPCLVELCLCNVGNLTDKGIGNRTIAVDETCYERFSRVDILRCEKCFLLINICLSLSALFVET